MKPFSWSFSGDSGTTLQGYLWKPESELKALIVLIHGIGEHAVRYQPVAERFIDQGFLVASFDLRGHGHSDGRRGHTPSYETWMQDIYLFLTELQKRYPNLPYIFYGHSLGGNLALNYVLRKASKIEGLIVSSPMLRTSFTTQWWIRLGATILNMFLPAVSLSNGLEAKDLSHDANVIQEYIRDPLIHDRISVRTFIDMTAAGEWALSNAHLLTVPTLIIHGTEDNITSCSASSYFSEEAGKLCEFTPFDGGFHELHHETFKDRVFEKILTWIKTQKLSL